MANMRCFRFQRWLLISAVVTNIIMLIYLAYLHDEMYFLSEGLKCTPIDAQESDSDLTIILREFESFDNDVVNGVHRYLDAFPDDVSIILLADTLPYPPLTLPHSDRLKIITMDSNFNIGYLNQTLTTRIRSEFVLIVPDGVKLSPAVSKPLQALLSIYETTADNIKVVAWAVDGSEDVQCLGLNVKLRQWTLQYYKTSASCDAISGKHVLLMRTSDLFSLAAPFSKPIGDFLYIQTTLKGWKVSLQKDTTWVTSIKLYENPHHAWKHRSITKENKVALYQEFGIKLVQDSGGLEWYGCKKDSERCFGTIHNNMPEYMYHGQWTPPCCLNALRITARHVFRILEMQGVRYWLEGGTLLGAMRNGDIIPWDYDVDIGIYTEDISKSSHLINCIEEAYEDEDGFVWEKATESEGEFYRVQYSASNRLHVDIFPFFPQNGTMTKNTWFKTHIQDMPFPEHYLKPLDKISFVGIKASAPNNAEQFLDLKFGKGVIANPKYPDLSEVT